MWRFGPPGWHFGGQGNASGYCPGVALINGAIVAEVGDFARFENARQTPSEHSSWQSGMRVPGNAMA